MTRLCLTSLVTIVLLALLSINCFANIGTVTEEKGLSNIVRDKTDIVTALDTSIDNLDNLITGNGVVGVTFKDNTKVRVTEHSKLLIDDFVYDSNKKGAGKLILKVAIGTVRYASGNIAHENNNSVDIKTPTATIAVRGTAFTMTVDEIGQSLVILLPNVDGSVGSIEVATAMGIVNLNMPFQATFISSNEVKPLNPVQLNLSESAINNMLIVSPPKEILDKIAKDIDNKSGMALDFNGLDINQLDKDVFKKDELAFNELDINLLDVDYLTNELDNALTESFGKGLNAVTQVYVIDKSTFWWIQRIVKDTIVLYVDKEKGYNITMIQGTTTITINTTDAITNTIMIKQTQ
jgi:hypothetical protein